MLINSVWGVSDIPIKSVTKVHGPTLLALRGRGWVGVKFRKKRYVTHELPRRVGHMNYPVEPYIS